MIKNIIFDIGNVILKWQPTDVVAKLFPDDNANELSQLLFKSNTWYELNLGKISEREAIKIYHLTLGIQIEKLKQLMHDIKESLLPIEGSFDLLMSLHKDYTLYGLTDNVHEIVAYIKAKYDFWKLFKGVIVSAEVGYLKPTPGIYQRLITDYIIDPTESVFIDDLLPNVLGAKSFGMHGIQFISAKQCIDEINEIIKINAKSNA